MRYKNLLLGICVILIFGGCGKESESPPPSPPPQVKSQVVRKKITARPDNMPVKAENQESLRPDEKTNENIIVKKQIAAPPSDTSEPEKIIAKTEENIGSQAEESAKPDRPDTPVEPIAEPVPQPEFGNEAGKASVRTAESPPSESLPEKKTVAKAEPKVPEKQAEEELAPWLKSRKSTEKKPGTSAPAGSSQKEGNKPGMGTSSEGDKELPGVMMPDKALAMLGNLKDKKTDAYNPEGKIDPFIPLFKKEKPVEKKVLEEKADAAENDRKKVVKRVRRERSTPLEKVDLSQLKLVGIIRGNRSGDKALVEDANRRGYIVTKGTYIGIHYGIVEDMRKDRIIVREEEGEDPSGKVNYRERELVIQRPPGQEF